MRRTIGLALCLALTGCAREAPERDGPPVPAPTRGAVFADVTASSGVTFVHDPGARGDFWLPEGIGSGGALMDYDGDDDLDLYLVQGGPLAGEADGPRNELWRNDGGWRFTDVSQASRADLPGYGLGAAAADYDADGDVDIYVTFLGPNALLRNEGDGTFREVGALAGVDDPGFGCSAAFLDYDRDGRLDLYVVNYVEWAPHREGACFDPSGIRDYCGPMDYDAPSIDRLYRGLPDGTFEDATESSGVATARGNGLGLLATDFDDDGDVDVYVANDQTPGFLWMNQGDGTFLEDAAIAGCGFNADGMAIAGMGTASEDLDGDGVFDLVVTNIHDQAHLALRNEGGVFTDRTHEWGFGGWGVPYTGFGVALFDQDHDGAIDGFVANGAVNRLPEPYRAGHDYAEPNQLVRRDASGRFRDASDEAGSVLGPGRCEMSRGVLSGDVDDDGDVDLVVTNNRGPVLLLRNDGASGAWIVVDLDAGDGGRHALNARVRVEAGGRVFVREVRPHASYLGTNDARVHFGLGDAHRVARLTVTWPDGQREDWEGLEVRRAYRIRRGGGPVPRGTR